MTDLDFADEESLLAATRAGDKEAFGRLVERHRAGLETFCFLMVGDVHDGKCALAEAVLCAWRGRELVEPILTARTWLYRNALLVCLGNLDVRR